MANTTSTSDTFNTSNAFIKYRILVTPVDNPPSGYTRINVKVQAWRTNYGYTTNRNGRCDVRLWTDGSSSATQIGSDHTHSWYVDDCPVKQNSYTNMYNEDIDIPNGSIVDNKVYVDARLFFYGSPQYTSTYQGFLISLVPVVVSPVVTANPTDIASNSITMRVASTEQCNEWGYTVLDKNGSEVIPWTVASTTQGLEQTFSISSLAQNTEYGVTCYAKRVGGSADTDYGYSARYNFRTVFYVPDPGSRITLFPENATDFTTNGLGSLSDVISCKVTEERNGAFELEMEYPVTGIHYKELEEPDENNGRLSYRKIILAKPDPYSKPQPFRIYFISKPFNGVVTINAAHISYDLTGYTVAPFKADSAYSVLNTIKSKMDAPSCPFDFWTNKTTQGTIETHIPMVAKSLLGGTEGSVLDTFKGEYEYDGFYVKLWEQRGRDTDVSIRYGKNLTDIKQEINFGNMYSHVRPYWYKEEGDEGNKTYRLVEATNKLIPVLDNLPFTRILPLDLSSEFDDAPKPADIDSLTQTFISLNNLTQPVVSISVSFVTLEYASEYETIRSLERIRLCDTLSVYFPNLGISVSGVKCVKTVFDVILQRYDSMDLGDVQTYLADTISKQNIALQNTVKKDEFQNEMAKVISVEL